jgi:hypothetical protein
MNEINFQPNRKLARGKDGLTPQNRQLVDKRRNQILLETGILQPRYAIINEAIHASLGGRGEGL